MNFSIKYKLFLTLLITTIAVVTSMHYLIRWSFERGFLEYINTVEREANNNLISTLEKAYSEEGSWGFLQGNDHDWRELRMSSMVAAKRANRPPHRNGAKENAKHPPAHLDYTSPHEKHRFRKSHGKHRFSSPRVTLFDENKTAVIGTVNNVDGMKLEPITLNNEIVGYC